MSLPDAARPAAIRPYALVGALLALALVPAAASAATDWPAQPRVQQLVGRAPTLDEKLSFVSGTSDAGRPRRGWLRSRRRPVFGSRRCG